MGDRGGPPHFEDAQWSRTVTPSSLYRATFCPSPLSCLRFPAFSHQQPDRHRRRSSSAWRPRPHRATPLIPPPITASPSPAPVPSGLRIIPSASQTGIVAEVAVRGVPARTTPSHTSPADHSQCVVCTRSWWNSWYSISMPDGRARRVQMSDCTRKRWFCGVCRAAVSARPAARKPIAERTCDIWQGFCIDTFDASDRSVFVTNTAAGYQGSAERITNEPVLANLL